MGEKKQKFPKCGRCRNNFPQVVQKEVRDILCEFCRGLNFEELREDDLKILSEKES